MYYIVGDIGNTSTRICLLNKKFKIFKSIIFKTKKIYNSGFIKKIFKRLIKYKIKKNFIFKCCSPCF